MAEELPVLMNSAQEMAEHELGSHCAAFRKLVTKFIVAKKWKSTKDFYKSMDTQYTSDDMFWIYCNAVGYPYFQPYAEEQGITSLTEFVNEAIKLKPLKNGDTEKYTEQFKAIYKRFIESGSEEDINVDPELRQQLKTEYDKL
jgi:hypothetical protein